MFELLKFFRTILHRVKKDVVVVEIPAFFRPIEHRKLLGASVAQEEFNLLAGPVARNLPPLSEVGIFGNLPSALVATILGGAHKTTMPQVL